MASFSTAEVLAEINRQSPAFGVDPNMITPLFMAENSGSGIATKGEGSAVSSKGASGLMQVMPSTAEGLKQAGLLPADWKHDANNLSSQVMAGIATVKDMLSRAKNPNDPLELAATYNGGNTGKSNYLAGKPLAPETSDYLRKYTVAANNLGIKMPENTDPNAAVPNNTLVGVTPSSSTPATGATTQRTTVRKNVSDPGVVDNFTQMITDAIGPGGTVDQAADTVIQGGATRFNALANLTNAITDKAKAAAGEAAVQSTIDSTEAVKRANILARLNMDPAALDNEATRTAGIVNDTDLQLATLKADIDQRTQVGMFDNPIEWLVNQTRLPGLTQQYNNIVGVQNASIDHYKTLVGIRDNEQKVATGMEADLIQQKGIQTQAKIAADANEQLNRVQVEATAATSRDALVMAQLSGTKANLAGSLLTHTQNKETVTTGNNARAEADAAAQRDLDNLNAVRVSAGGNKIESIAAFKSLPAKNREVLLSAGSSGKFGNTFGESMEYVTSQGNLDRMTLQKGAAVRPWVMGTLAAAQVPVTANVKATGVVGNPLYGKKIDTAKELSEQLGVLQDRYQVEAATDMRTASTNNPMKLAYTAIAKMPELADNPVAAFINTYGPNGKEPRFAKVDEQYLLQRFAFSVGTGLMPISDASKAIADFYKVGTQQQAASTSWPLFGLEKPDKTYIVQIPGSSLLASGDYSPSMTVDMGNPVDVENFLTKSVAANARVRQSNNPASAGIGAGFVKPPL